MYQSFFVNYILSFSYIYIYIYIYLGVVANEKGAFGSPSTTVANFTLIIYVYMNIYIEMALTVIVI